MLDFLSWTPTTCPTGLAFWVSSFLYAVLFGVAFVGAVLGLIGGIAGALYVGTSAYDRLMPARVQSALNRRWNTERAGTIFITGFLLFMGGAVLSIPALSRRDAFYATECEPICAEQGLEVKLARYDSCLCVSEVVEIPRESPCW